ncbi:ComF family protein [Candidatus Daviesbacteria bacterium]|nr:ComF family protein [Candidatus Daviesbacteria bacterium]
MNLLLDLVFPKFCVGCGKFGSYFCPKCVENITQTELVCPNCERAGIGGKTHPLCQRKCGLDGLWSLGIYQGSLKKAIQKLKYKFVKDLAQVLVDLMVIYWAKYSAQFLTEIRKEGVKSWVVVPVPLHSKRQKWRGFNQSALLGQILAQKLGLDYQEVLKRVRYTAPQVGMEAWKRKQNIKNAFSLTNPYTLDSKPCVLLVDDVWTTGSTLKECAYILKKSGAKKVWAITLAR